MPPPRRGDRNESFTVLRACEILKAFRHPGEELHLADVIDRTQLPRTTAFRLLRTLVHGDLLESTATGVYRSRFGPGVTPERPPRRRGSTRGE